MPLWLQNLVVLLAVAASLTVVGRQAFSTLRGRKSKLGSCCSKGCSANGPGGSPNPASPTQRIVFLPVDMLGRKKK